MFILASFYTVLIQPWDFCPPHRRTEAVLRRVHRCTAVFGRTDDGSQLCKSHIKRSSSLCDSIIIPGLDFFDVPLGLSVSSLVRDLSDECCRGPRSLFFFGCCWLFLSWSGLILATSIAKSILRSDQGSGSIRATSIAKSILRSDQGSRSINRMDLQK